MTQLSRSTKVNLLLDSRIIKKTENARLTLGKVTKHPENPLFGEDKPWEPRFDNLYPNVIYDEEDKLYKCWYNPMIIEEMTTSIPKDERNPYAHPDYAGIKPNRREMGVCYAVSKDGIHWEKPELGIVEFGGNKKNNILMLRGVNGAGVFKDPTRQGAIKSSSAGREKWRWCFLRTACTGAGRSQSRRLKLTGLTPTRSGRRNSVNM